MTDSQTPEGLASADPTLVSAVERAMNDLGADWCAREVHLDDTERTALRVQIRDRIRDLGFADVLTGPDDRDAWPEAAAVVHGAAQAAVPVDMALWILSGDADAAIADDAPLWKGQTPTLDVNADALRLMRSIQCSAALHAALDMAIGYVQDRKQFGRALAKFQAIQYSLSVAAEHAAAADAATRMALAAVHGEGLDSARSKALLDAATLVTDDAVDVVYDVTHQVHGAIGFTREYGLHRHTINLQRWRDSAATLGGHGADARLGARVAARGGLWQEVTSLMAAR